MARKKLHVNPSNEQGCVKNSTQLSRRRFFIFYYFVWAPAQGSLKIKITTAAVNYNGPAAAEWLILLLFTVTLSRWCCVVVSAVECPVCAYILMMRAARTKGL